MKVLQKYEEILGETLPKYIGSNYTIEFKEYVKPYHAKHFLTPKYSQTNSQERS